MTCNQGNACCTRISDDMCIRKLEVADYDKGYLECLKDLTDVGDVTKEQFTKRYDEIAAKGDAYHMFVVVHRPTGNIVGAASIILERKFIHNCSSVGHLEDVVIKKEYHMKGIGKTIVRHVVEHARSLGCYKVIANVKKELLPFYNKCGLEKRDEEMAIYFK
ncbi:MAG: glucosamine-6-phosphate N-acetyltransferase [Amphiamblys sp. WSBS2006]|nr:MAG: glucosamine-6-phosphate N-acetyltransferase [Amphiamblys sp. WSBS2006]